MAGQEQSEQPQKQKRWRFSLKTLLLLTTLVALVIGLEAWILPLAVLVEGLSGASWFFFGVLWAVSLYLVRQDYLASTNRQNHGETIRSPLNLAKRGCLLIACGCTRAFVATQYLYPPSGVPKFPSPDRYADLLALYLYLIGFSILVFWVPRRKWLPQIEISDGWRITLSWLYWLMMVMGPGSLLVGLPVLMVTVNLHFALFVWSLVVLTFSHQAAGVLLVFFLLIGLVFDHFPAQKTCFLLAYCGAAWAFLVHALN